MKKSDLICAGIGFIIASILMLYNVSIVTTIEILLATMLGLFLIAVIYNLYLMITE